MNVTHRTLCYGGLALAICLLCVWLRPPAGSPTEGMAPAPIIEDPGHAVPHPIPSASMNERMAASRSSRAGLVLVLVRSVVGVPIVGASLYVCEPSQSGPRWCAESDLLRIAATSVDGYAEIAAIALCNKRLSVRASGYQASDVVLREIVPDGLVTLEMSPSLALVVECKTRDGTPLPGVEVCVSPAPLAVARPPVQAFRDMVPGVIPAVAIYSAVSRGDGRAELIDVPMGRLFIQLCHESCVVVDGLPAGNVVSVERPMNRLQVVFDPVYYAAAFLLDDSLLSWSAKCPEQCLMRPDLDDSLASFSSRLASRSGGSCISFVAVARFSGGQYMDPPSVLSVEVLTSRCGRATVEIPMWPMRKESSPDGLTLQKQSPVEGSDIEFVLSTPSGRQLASLEGFFLHPLEDDAISRLAIDLQAHSAPLRLPNGRYVVRTAQPSLRRALAAEVVDVKSSGRVVVKVGLEVSPCLLEWRCVSGLIVDSGEVTIEHSGQMYQMVRSRGLSTSAVLLPVGRCVLSIVTTAGSKRGVEVNVASHADLRAYAVGVLQ